VKIPDLNLLLYAVNAQSPMHLQAKRWFETQYSTDQTVGYAWVVILGFIRLCTKRGIMEQPLDTTTCLAILDTLLNHPSAQIVHPSERHMGILGRLLLGAGTAGNLSTDAHLAALAIENGAELVTFDRDFERFAGLRFSLLTA
jgi:toxin-antitoxin system PIN domain toxin